jgi:predicted DsbA family dithiol-disulfide isomerase
MSVVEVTYYTDPVCPWSWGLEPAMRKLSEEFAGEVRFTYVMCGMVRQLEGGVAQDDAAFKLLSSSLEAAWQSLMPADPRPWLDDPPRSSHPACIAVKAAEQQGDPARLLRRLREGFLCRRRRLDGAQALLEESRHVPGIDPERFAIDFHSHATLEAFGADLDLAKAAAQRAGEKASDGRPELPSLEFRGADGGLHGVYGFADYEELRRAAIAAGAEPTRQAPPTIEQALRRYATMTSAEAAAVCDLPGPRAPAELWRLALEWRVKAERVHGGEFWTLA